MKTIKQIALLKIGAFIAVGTIAASLTACGGGDSPKSSSSLPANTGVATTPGGALGKQVWVANCQSCHGLLTSKANFPANVRNAINNNTGGMGSISVTQADLDNLAAYATNPSAY
jgi:mono/diheme cytochrome c family protein